MIRRNLSRISNSRDLGGGTKKTMNELTKLFKKQKLVVKTAAKMQKIILMGSNVIEKKGFLGLSKVT